MKHPLTLITLLLVALSTGGQQVVAHPASGTGRDISDLVSRLSWDSVGGRCDYVWLIFPRGEAAEELIKIGEPATDELLKVLEDETRGVAAHLILTQIWERGKFEFGTRREGERFIHTYNGLEWSVIPRDKGIGHEVEKAALAKNAQEWRRKLAEYKANK